MSKTCSPSAASPRPTMRSGCGVACLAPFMLAAAHPSRRQLHGESASGENAGPVRSNGIDYDSGRLIGADCAAVFWLPLRSNTRQERRFCYIWDSWQIATICEKGCTTPCLDFGLDTWYEKRKLDNDGLFLGLDDERAADPSKRIRSGVVRRACGRKTSTAGPSSRRSRSRVRYS